MTTCRALTVVAEIVPERRADLERALRSVDLSRLPDTHFARLVIVDDDRGELPALLVWEANHDGARSAYLAACARAVPALDEIFGCCKPRRHLRSEAFYCAYRGVGHAQVVHARRVRDAIHAYLDAHRRELGGLAPVEIQRRLIEHVRATGLDVAPRDRGGLELFVQRALATAALVPLLALVILLLPITGPAAYLAYRELRRRERDEGGDKATRPVHDDARHQDVEDKIRQNQFTHVVDIKPGRLRMFLLRGVLLVIDLIARTIYVHGELGGIESIHFARWVLLKDPAGKRHRLLFFSNYDGSWDAYLGEFIDRASPWLTAVWSNTEGFPRTEGLINQGARDEETFKQWTRDHQIPSQVWWSFVPDSTVQNVRDDVWIGRRLARPLGDEELVHWLRRL